jgi:hypothetical protein
VNFGSANGYPKTKVNDFQVNLMTLARVQASGSALALIYGSLPRNLRLSGNAVHAHAEASEAISAALYLDGRVRRAQSTGSWPTCVQKRGFFGGWKNTPVLK